MKLSVIPFGISSFRANCVKFFFNSRDRGLANSGFGDEFRIQVISSTRHSHSFEYFIPILKINP